MIGGLIGVGSGLKKSFVASWISMVNLSFSIYISVFLAPLAVSLLDIPGLAAGYKNAIAIAGIFFIINFILPKITEQIIPNPDINFNLPSVSRFLSIFTCFLSGFMIAGILLYCFMQTPFVSGLPQKKELRATARNTLMGVVHTLNIFSFQSLSPEAEKELQAIRLIPKKKTTSSGGSEEQDEDDQKNQPKPAENKSADGSVKKDSADNQPGKEGQKAETKPAKKSKKKDSAASSGSQQEKPAENKKAN
ncbi:MAG: hypothetical protein IKO93_20860 [Lentisphaeria bacterium]|nr:hypothetical protein [Lentisphaeria bacterium]